MPIIPSDKDPETALVSVCVYHSTSNVTRIFYLGMRFALIEVKILLAHLILKYELSLKPGFELTVAKSLQTLRANDNGIQIIMEPVDKQDSKSSDHSEVDESHTKLDEE